MSEQTEREARYATAIHDATCSGEDDCYGDDETEGAQARAVIAVADQEWAELTARVRELEAALQQSRDDHQGAAEKLRAVKALADEWVWLYENTSGNASLDTCVGELRTALAPPAESDAEDAK